MEGNPKRKEETCVSKRRVLDHVNIGNNVQVVIQTLIAASQDSVPTHVSIGGITPNSEPNLSQRWRVSGKRSSSSGDRGRHCCCCCWVIG